VRRNTESFGNIAGEPNRVLFVETMIHADKVAINVGIVLDIDGQIVDCAANARPRLVGRTTF